MVNGECKAGRSVVSDTSDRIVTEAPFARSQTGGSSSESDRLQDKEQDCTPNFESSEAIICRTNRWTSILTTPNPDKGPDINKDTDPTNSMRKQHGVDRNRASRGCKASNNSGTAFLIPYRLADSMLSSSKKITSESIPVYKIPAKVTMRRKNSMIARQSIGSPRRVARLLPEKVLMVVGATAAGKTTLINGMVSYILGVEWKDNFRFKLIVEDNGLSQANSQTKNITAYTFHPMGG